MIDLVDDDSVLMYAIKSYERPGCVKSEFESDFKRFKYIKRILNKYRLTKDIKERLILNHIIILANVFGIEATVRILMYKLAPEDFPAIKTFFIFLNFMPKYIQSIRGQTIISSDIPLDLPLVELLRKLQREV